MEQEVNPKSKQTQHKTIKPGSRIDKFIKLYVDNGKQLGKAVAEAGYTSKQPHNTGHFLLKRPEVLNAIKQYEDELKHALIKDRPKFLMELRELRQRAREKGKIDAEIKIAGLEANILGITQPDQAQQINIFSLLDKAYAHIKPEENAQKHGENTFVDASCVNDTQNNTQPQQAESLASTEEAKSS